MPKLKKGTIPTTRLSAARRVKAYLAAMYHDRGKVVLSIHSGGFSVDVKLYEDDRIPKYVDGVPVRSSRIDRPENS